MAKPESNKCGANELLDNVQNKAEDIKNKITEQLGLGADASTIRDNLKELLAPLDQAMTEVAPKLAAIAPVSLQAGIKDFIGSFDAKKLATPNGKNQAASKLALLEKDFGPKLKEKGLTLNDLIKKTGGALGLDIDTSSINAGIAKDSADAASFLSGTGSGSLTGELSSAFGGAYNALTGGTSALTGGLTGSVQENNAGLLSTVTSLTGGGLEGNAAGLTALKNTSTGAPLSFCEIGAGQGGFTFPNIEIPSNLSGSGVTEEEREVRSSTGLLVISIKDEYKEIKSVQGKREGSPFFTNIQGYKISPTNSGIILLPSYKEGDKNWDTVKVTYIVELVKEKPVEIAQADTDEAKEKVSPVTTNLNSIFKKKEFSVNSLLGKLSNLSTSSLPADELKKTDIRAAIDKAKSEISDPAYQSKLDAHVKKSYGELSSLFSGKYRSVPIKSGDGEIIQTEVVTNTDSIIETTNETTGVKTVEKAAVAEKGFLDRPREISKKYQKRTFKGVGLVKDDPTGIIWKFEADDGVSYKKTPAVFGNGQVEIRRGIAPTIHEVKKIHGIEFDGSGNVKNEYFWYSDDGAKKELKFILNRPYEEAPAHGIVIQSNKNPPIPKPKEDFDGIGVEAIKMMNKHSNLIDVKISGQSGALIATWAPGFVPTGDQAGFKIGPRGRPDYNEFSLFYGNNVPRVPQLPLPSIVSFKLDAIAMTYITLEKLNPK